MGNESPIEYTFKKKDRQAPAETNSMITIEGETIPADPQLLLQLLLLATAAGDVYENPVESFKHKLCSFP